MFIPAMSLVVPSSVTASGSATGSVSATGKVTFNNVSSTDNFTINGCFSAAYEHYVCVWTAIGSGSISNPGFSIRLSSGGSDDNTQYYYQRLYAGGSGYGAATVDNGTQWHGGQVGNVGREGWLIYFFRPYLSATTSFRTVSAASTDDVRLDDSTGTHAVASSFDGFKFWLGAASWDGSCTIYGFNQ